MVVFESIARPLLFLHLIAATCVTASAVHLAIRVWGYLRGNVTKVPFEKTYARLLVVSYAVCYVLGAIVYPAFRVRVRAEYFDAAVPWATGLFEVKEHLATLGMVIAVGIWLLSRAIRNPLDENDRRLLPLYAGLIASVLFIIGYDVWSGWYLTTLKAV
jgi:cytochrome bd-type quinol oxidase subunit 1